MYANTPNVYFTLCTSLSSSTTGVRRCICRGCNYDSLAHLVRRHTVIFIIFTGTIGLSIRPLSDHSTIRAFDSYKLLLWRFCFVSLILIYVCFFLPYTRISGSWRTYSWTWNSRMFKIQIFLSKCSRRKCSID